MLGGRSPAWPTTLNQLAHWANARQQLPPGFDKALGDVVRMERAVEELRLTIDQAHRGQR